MSDPLTLVLLAAASLLPTDLGTASGVRAIPARDAQPARRVHLAGVVTFCSPPHGFFYVQDDTAGVRVEWPRGDKTLFVGDRVEVWGVTAAGALMPEVQADLVRVTGKQRLPRPTAFDLTSDACAYLDGQWVEVEAVVQRAWATDAWLQLDLARGRGNAVATLPLQFPIKVLEAEKLRGAVVTVRGVCRTSTNAAGQVTGPARLFVSYLWEFEAVKPPPEDPFALPPTTARDLARFCPNPIEARLPVRVSGVVTLDQGGRQLYLQDDTGVVQVAYTNRAAVAVGQRVTAVGFPRLGADPVRLDNAHVRVNDAKPGALPAPHPGTIADGAAGKLDGRVVTFTGTVLDAGAQGGLLTATVAVDGMSFAAVFLDEGTAVEPGSRVEVVGVATRQPLDKFRPHTFAVIVRTGGLRVLEPPPRAADPPPWWTGRRVAYLSAGFVGLFLAGGAGATVFRLQVRRAAALARRETAEKEKLEGLLKLAAQLETVGRLTGGIAHDFNNLLTVINGCAALLEKEIGGDNDPPRAAKFAAAIRRAGEQAAALTRQLLVFSSHRAVALAPLDLNRALAGTLDILDRLLGDRITVALVTASDLRPAVAEAGLLSQVVFNLAVNAADAMPDGGTFTLTTCAGEPGWVRLTATDTGTGMTDEVKARAFERGFTTKGADKGTGLGLATVYGIVQRFGGRIRFTSARAAAPRSRSTCRRPTCPLCPRRRRSRWRSTPRAPNPPCARRRRSCCWWRTRRRYVNCSAMSSKRPG